MSVTPTTFVWRAWIGVAIGLVLGACTPFFDTDLPRWLWTGQDATDDAGTDAADDATTDTTAPDVDPPDGADATADTAPEFNPCGGREPLRWDGGAASPGDGCGCGGFLVCDGIAALKCARELDRNVCGGCGALPGTPGDTCGACGDGVWICAADGGARCVGAATPNGCGGCSPLDGAPGVACDLAEGGQGVWTCAGVDRVACRGAGSEDNACGGVGPLRWEGRASRPGASCSDEERLCGAGTLVCATDGGSLACEGVPRNAAGGCGTLLGVPGQPCGCGGVWARPESAAPGLVVCSGGAPNACGGCGALVPSPGEPCGANGVRICNGPGATICADRSAMGNVCGGEQALDEVPGVPCGVCDEGRLACVGTDETACEGGGTNACGGCGALVGAPDGRCGPCGIGTLTCSPDNGSLFCDTSTVDPFVNACGGCTTLVGTPGEACGRCATWTCAGEESLRCEADPTRPGC